MSIFSRSKKLGDLIAAGSYGCIYHNTSQLSCEIPIPDGFQYNESNPSGIIAKVAEYKDAFDEYSMMEIVKGIDPTQKWSINNGFFCNPNKINIKDCKVSISNPRIILSNNGGMDLAKYLSEFYKTTNDEKLVSDFIINFLLNLKNILEGITALNNNKVYHRDIKFNNIVWDQEKKFRLIDFGMACEPSSSYSYGIGFKPSNSTYPIASFLLGYVDPSSIPPKEILDFAKILYGPTYMYPFKISDEAQINKIRDIISDLFCKGKQFNILYIDGILQDLKKLNKEDLYRLTLKTHDVWSFGILLFLLLLGPISSDIKRVITWVIKDNISFDPREMPNANAFLIKYRTFISLLRAQQLKNRNNGRTLRRDESSAISSIAGGKGYGVLVNNNRVTKKRLIKKKITKKKLINKIIINKNKIKKMLGGNNEPTQEESYEILDNISKDPIIEKIVNAASIFDNFDYLIKNEHLKEDNRKKPEESSKTVN